MANFRITRRPLVHILAASLIAGFAVQTEWAVSHDFEYYGTRVFVSALVLFILLQTLKILLRRAQPSSGEYFDENYGEMVLLLSVLPVFQIVENGFVQIILALIYIAIVIGYGASVLGITWCINLQNWFGNQAAVIYTSMAGRRLSYRVQDDIEPNVLHVRLRVPDDNLPSSAEIKARLADLYERLPDRTDFKAIKVNIDDANTNDDMLVRLLEPLAYYARLCGLDTVLVTGPEEALKRLSKVLPEQRYSLQRSA